MIQSGVMAKTPINHLHEDKSISQICISRDNATIQYPAAKTLRWRPLDQL